MILDSKTLEKVIEGCKANNRKSQRILYESYYPRFMRVTQRYVKDPNVAEECLNQAFLRIFKKIGDYSGTGSFEGWMNTIVVRQALSQIKEDTRKRVVKNISPLGDIEVVDKNSTDSLLLEKEIFLEIHKLPRKMREVFLDYLDGKKYKQISKDRGITEGTSKWYVFEARSAMKKRLTLLGI